MNNIYLKFKNNQIFTIEKKKLLNYSDLFKNMFNDVNLEQNNERLLEKTEQNNERLLEKTEQNNEQENEFYFDLFTYDEFNDFITKSDNINKIIKDFEHYDGFNDDEIFIIEHYKENYNFYNSDVNKKSKKQKSFMANRDKFTIKFIDFIDEMIDVYFHFIDYKHYSKKSIVMFFNNESFINKIDKYFFSGFYKFISSMIEDYLNQKSTMLNDYFYNFLTTDNKEYFIKHLYFCSGFFKLYIDDDIEEMMTDLIDDYGQNSILTKEIIENNTEDYELIKTRIENIKVNLYLDINTKLFIKLLLSMEIIKKKNETNIIENLLNNKEFKKNLDKYRSEVIDFEDEDSQDSEKGYMCEGEFYYYPDDGPDDEFEELIEEENDE